MRFLLTKDSAKLSALKLRLIFFCHCQSHKTWSSEYYFWQLVYAHTLEVSLVKLFRHTRI